MSKLIFYGHVFQRTPVMTKNVNSMKCGPLFRLCKYHLYSTHNPNTPKSHIKWFWMPAGVGFALISCIQLRHVWKRERQQGEPHKNNILPWQVNLFKVIPTRALSRFWGLIHNIELPVSLRAPVVLLWTWAFGCCLDEAEESDPRNYHNLGEFFTRKLKQGARDIDQSCELVSPVDGKVLHFGPLIDGKFEQVKGVSYSLGSFLGPQTTLDAPSNEGKAIYQCVLYLGPGDCHHIHSPAEWRVKKRRHFPGELVSVSPWVLRTFQDVLCTNERVSLYGNWKHGAFTMTAVGAYNVGSINVLFDVELKTNQKKAIKGKFFEKKFGESMTLSRGSQVGWFEMGSAVVLIFEGPDDFEFKVTCGQKIKQGQALGIRRN